MTVRPPAPGAADLLRSVGLLPDGPVLWGRKLPRSGPGVLIVELPAPLSTAPLDLARVGKWIERVPELRLDGRRPTSKALAGRLASFWLPEQTVLFVAGSTAGATARASALQQTALGDRRPYAGGAWLHTLQGLDRMRIWWAETDAAEEYEDGVLSAFEEAAMVAPPVDGRPGVPRPTPVLPWAVQRRPTGERRDHGLTGAVLPAPATPAPPPTSRREVAAAAAEGTDPPLPRLGGVRKTTDRAPAAAGAGRSTGRSGRASAGAPRTRTGGSAGGRGVEAVQLSQEGHDRLQAELHDLRAVRRPAAIRRVASARELGDLRENSEYHAAREELGFIEGRIQQLEGRLRHAVIVADATGETVQLGSTVVVESDGEQMEFRLVSSAEADPASGRISTGSPVGGALMGHGPGSEVRLMTPGGTEVSYRILEVR